MIVQTMWAWVCVLGGLSFVAIGGISVAQGQFGALFPTAIGGLMTWAGVDLLAGVYRAGKETAKRGRRGGG